ncbi:hypothetical protein [Hyalangium gracile]|uniref:hypothetical protein n=1 Tax=Hyalangium gracile TaxID=394092 RepID=UPI001CCC6706|nr:hypothetical protein [Hyalangium gracile]
MQVNNLGGVRMPVTTTDSTAQTARASFSTRLQGSAGAPTTGRVGIAGSSIVSTAMVNSGAVPGSAFGGPYMQARSAGVPGIGVPGTTTTTPQSQVPGTGTPATQGPNYGTTTPPAAGSEFNGELQAMFAEQKAMNDMKELMKMSLLSFVSSTFAMGQSRGSIEALD